MEETPDLIRTEKPEVNSAPLNQPGKVDQISRSIVRALPVTHETPVGEMEIHENLLGTMSEGVRKVPYDHSLTPKNPKNWGGWVSFFEARSKRLMPQPDASEIPERVAPLLLRSLRIFQLGECGEGRIVNELRKSPLPGTDDDYIKALGLFVKEEGRHAQVLARCVHALHGETIKKIWAATLFSNARRLLGPQFELTVLLAAEVIAVGFYGTVASHLPEGSIRQALEEVCNDEKAHLEFHRDFFRSRGNFSAFFSKIALLGVGLAAIATVILDHRKLFKALNIRWKDIGSEFLKLLNRALRY